MQVCYIYLLPRYSNRSSDTDEQLEEFRKDPAKLAKYSRDIEGELNKRFTLVCIPYNLENKTNGDLDAQDK